MNFFLNTLQSIAFIVLMTIGVRAAVAPITTEMKYRYKFFFEFIAGLCFFGVYLLIG